MKTKLISTILIALLTLPAMAFDYEENGIGYTINNSTKSASVIGYNSSVIAQNEGVVNIPEAISFNGRTYSVTSIGERAFYDCTGLTSITIPSSVTSIGENAFYDCTGLTSVNITDIAAWCGISFGNISSNPLYYSEHLYLNGEEVKQLTIPSSVTSIGSYAFRGCTSLTTVTIPESVTSIGHYAFSVCRGLTSVTIPESVTTIGDNAFSSCRGLTSVTIPESVTTIGNYAFSSCSGLTSVTIPESVTSISWGAFNGCTGLTSITIPNSVTSIMLYAFCSCTGLKSITIGNSVTSIRSSAFIGCPNITSIYSFAVKPPSIDSETFDADVVKTKATLYVLPEAISAYQNHTYWKQFWIEEMDESMTGIEDIKISSEDDAPTYDLYGRQIMGKPQSGQIYIRNGKKTLAM